MLSLPYLYTTANQENTGCLPFSSELIVDLPPSTFVQATLLSVFREELITVQGLHDTQVVDSATAAGFGLHDLP